MRRKAIIMMLGAFLLTSFVVNIEAAKPTVKISASPTSIVVGSSSTLTWTSTGATSASINQGIGNVAVNGSKVVSPAATTTYTITARNSSGSTTATATVTVKAAPPTVSFSAAPNTIAPGGSATLSWTTTNATSASIDQNIGTVALNGSKVVKPTTTKTYTITVKGSGGTVTSKATVTVAAVKPTVTISAEPITIQPGEESTLTWTSTNATSATIDNGIGSVSTVSSTTVYPAITTTYTITVSGPGGTASASATVTVIQPQPLISLKAIPAAILPGESSTLCWQTTNVDSTIIDNGVGAVPTNGSIRVSPVTTTTYTMNASGPGGTANAAVTVSVDGTLQPSVSIYSSLQIVASGGEIVLSWNAPHAESASIDNGIGSVQPKGSLRITPNQSTTYTITAENSNGIATAAVAVELKSSPRCYAYIPNSYDNTVSIIDITNYPTVVKTIPVGNQPQSSAVSPDGMFAYIANYSSQSISVINAGTNTVISTIGIGGDPYYLAFHPGGKLLYAIVEKTGAGDSTYAIVAINTETGLLVKELNLGNNELNGIAFHPDGSRLYTATWDKVLVIDTAINEIMLNIPSAGAFDIALSPDGSRLYVISHDGYGENVSVFDTATNSVIRKLTVCRSNGNRAELLDVAVNPLGNEVYVVFADSLYKPLAYIDTSTFDIKKSCDFYNATPKSLAIKPDGSQVFALSSMLHFFPYIPVNCQGWIYLDNGPTANGNFIGYIADTVAGKVTQNNVGIEGITLTITGAGVTKTVLTDANGNYVMALKNGTYTITPSRGNDLFSPSNRQVIIGRSLSGQDFAVIDTSVPPTVTLKIAPDKIYAGDDATLFWTSTNAATAMIDNGFGNVPVNGSVTVIPTSDTTYKITVSNTVLTASATAKIYVNYLLPTVSIAAAPVTINAGESSTLTWTSSYASSASIDHGIGTVAVNGSIVVTPAATTTYAITVSGPKGSTSAQATVTVNNPYSSVLTGTVIDFSSGQPITGVLVTAVDSASQTKTAQTDAAGNYTISSLAPGNVQVSFAKSGYDPYQQTINIPANTIFELATQLRLTLVGATLHGLVKDGQTTQPIAGATITAVFTGGSLSATSGSDGAYTLVGIPLNTPVKITASAVNYHDKIITTTYTMNTVFVYDFDLYGTSALATVNGKITNSKTLLPEAGVTVTHEGSNIAVTSAADGTFVFNDMAFGEQTFIFEKTDFINEIITCTIDRTPFTIDLIKPGNDGGQITVGQNVSGIIRDLISHSPIAGAKVRIPYLGLEVLSDANGNYSLNDLTIGNYSLIILAVNHQSMNFMASVIPGETNKVDAELIPIGIGLISGKITDAATGEPVADASIDIEGSSVLADASEGDGTYKMVGVPPGIYKVVFTHADYSQAFAENVEVFELSPTTVNIQLNKRPQTGALEGIISDINTGNPVSGATVVVPGTAISATTDGEGKYRLTNVPSGLNNITVSASGYPDSPRIRAVIADETPTSSSTTVSNIPIDPASSTVNEAVTQLIRANEGGDIISRDSRFVLHIFPDTLSADANITLKEVSYWPSITMGGDLPLDPALAISGVKVASVVTKIQIAAVNPDDPAPNIDGLAAVAMRYSQKDVDDFQLDENTAFPYFWNGTNFSAMNPRPYEIAVDKTNNIVYAVMDFSKTLNGDAVHFSQSMSETNSMHSANATNGISIKEIGLIIGNTILDKIYARPRVRIFDKNELSCVTNAAPEQKPNPNALPLLVMHGFDPWSTLVSLETNPNTEERSRLMLQDIVEATNGVYRPVFVSYNTKAKIAANGGKLAEKIFGEYLNQKAKIKGLPAKPDDPNSGNFPYLDTFSYSMGGVLARSFRNKSTVNMVHNMVMIATPNHGTANLLNYLSKNNPFFLALIDNLKWLNSGATDLLDYDDGSAAGREQNPFLFDLNSPGNSQAVSPRGDMTLFAGNDNGGYGFFGRFLQALLAYPNDSLVPVRSVFCIPSSLTPPIDADANYYKKNSMLKVYGKGAQIAEVPPKNFSHDNVGKTRRIVDFITEITLGLSDWTVDRFHNEGPMDFDSNSFDPPNVGIWGHGNAKVKVDYNVWDGSNGRMARDIDRVVLVIYHKDGNGHWHISPPNGGENGADTNGTVNQNKVIEIKGNSIARPKDNPLILTANVFFEPGSQIKGEGYYDPEKHIVDIIPLFIPLKPGKMTVPLDPTKSSFRTPFINE